MTDDNSTLIENVKRVLLADWDPILLQELPIDFREANTDEYDRYVGPIVQMILQSQELRALEEHLLGLEMKIAGRTLDNRRTHIAAQKLFDLEPIFSR